ncbi:helix-turn-helix domain-containing protein [Brachybacterium fresconis]|uniref:Transcriptional regulator with XRE-family HTH domain n=1 Tax=Brachybacterium fresconis TaxID=173363 RepID=A0ABS4YLZ4_9MICO|nr:helix-turn-helix transcriptional regulator [Brachybacterium fresconis]MBP2409520.1 transcriptional regulator with XRE-family HTH domain [Brachybacterium fresconis]
MDHRAEVSQFLRTRRDRITPEQAGIIGGSRRRVPGLRREEVAMLAGVSVEYYARMERGELGGVSTEVLESIAHALRLEEAEIDHLADLARAAGPRPVRKRRKCGERGVTPAFQRFLDAVTGAPMWVRDRRMDFVASNALGRALYAPLFEDPSGRANTARFTFLDPAARTFFPDWEQNADGIVATMRTYAGQNPLDTGLTDVIGELVTRSDAFRQRWSVHDVRHHRAGLKRIHHPVVGDLELSYEAMDLPANPEWSLFAYTAEPGSATEERIRLLGSLAATDHPALTAHEPAAEH